MSSKSKAIQDPGYGNSNTSFGRLVNKDGSFNVVRKRVGLFQSQRAYNWLLTISWGKFLAISFSIFVIANLIFAIAFFLCGPEAISADPRLGTLDRFMQAFYFSVQTSATIGYGRLIPTGFLPNMLVVVESFGGVIMVALATGVVFARFSRPVSTIKSSKNALLAPYKKGSAFMFRIANSVNHQVIELEVKVFLSRVAFVNGAKEREFFRLELERDVLATLPLSWTIVHEISEDSPLFGLSSIDMEEARSEIIITIMGLDETLNQTVYSRTSYRASDIVDGAKFIPMFERSADGSHSVLDMSLLNAYSTVDLTSSTL